MRTFTLQTHINAPPDAVFAVATDFAHAAENIKGVVRVEMLTGGPVGLGTRFKETRIMFGREATEEFAVTEFTPGQRYALTVESCGCRYVAAHRVIPEAGDTRFELEMTMGATSLFARLMSPLARFMIGGMKKAMQQDLDELKAAAEARAKLPAAKS